jgi:hypothetical protein
VHENHANYLWMFVPCLVLLTYVGCPTAEASADVELELETRSGTYSSRVSESSYVGFYYNADPGSFMGAIPAAIAPAINKALLDIRSQISAKHSS